MTSASGLNGSVLVTGSSVDDRFLEPLRAAGLEVRNLTHLLSEDELGKELTTSSAYLLGGDEVATATALSETSTLKVIAFLGVGYESFIDVPAATTRGIAVTNTPGTLTNSMAEFTIGQLLNARRRLTQYTEAFMSGRHDTETKQRDLAGTSIGIVGLGTIGTRVAETLRIGFGCDVSYFSRTRKPDVEERLGVTHRPLQELAANSDALVVLTPGNAETAGLIGDAVLENIKPDSLLINTARASIVNPASLLKALESGRVSIAVLDGFYDSDVPEREALLALGMERLLVTGHIGSLTSDARDGMAIMAVQSILNFLTNGTDAHVLNLP
jgi:glyoxylate reductase